MCAAIRHYDMTVLCGHRGEAEQNAKLEQGLSRVAFPGSRHNRTPSEAVDVVPWYTQTPHIRWDAREDFTYMAGIIMGVAGELGVELVWGGNWDRDQELGDNGFDDLPHFQLVSA